MQPDEQGFLYPVINIKDCIECNLCNRICPVINQYPPRNPKEVYAAKNTNDEIITHSSSGGIFYELAVGILKEGGVVFGAKYNSDWTVEHGYTESITELELFMGSKYMQSVIGDSYLQTKKFLDSNRKVLFSGTPCQIAGLKRFLRKDYSNLLLTVDVICHGVPSPMIWDQYLQRILKPYGMKKSNIKSLSFRDKSTGWADYSLKIEAKTPINERTIGQKSTILKDIHRKNVFMNIFLNNFCLRPSCYNCPAKAGKSSSDISLGDFWDIQYIYPEFYSQSGVSLILRYDDKPLSFHGLKLLKSNYKMALSANNCIEKSCPRPNGYFKLWNLIESHGIDAMFEYEKKLRPSIFTRAYYKITNMLRRRIASWK